MLLRPRQKTFVERSVRALDEHGNTLGVAPTGSGKTLMLSGVVGRMLAGSEAKACVLAHRDELTAQNVLKFAKVNPALSTSIVDARTKSWRGRATFAMVPTLARAANLEAIPALDLVVVDEAHHAAADSYRRIIDRARERNPDVRIYGVTATPNRGDKKGLRPVFSNVADQILLGELIGSGHLVRPRTFVIDVGTQEALRQVRRTVDDFDMKAVDAIMNTAPITEAVIGHWREKAGDRQTVVFCSTVDHARNVCDAFAGAGVAAGMVWHEMGSAERRTALAAYRRGETRVMVNVAVLTEGWDHPPTSCVVLLRPSSYKSTLIQMVGRGLRVVDPAEFPGVIKIDCVVLDFGTSSLIHGCLEQDVDLDGKRGRRRGPDQDLSRVRCPGSRGGARMPALRLSVAVGRRRCRGRRNDPARRLRHVGDRSPEALELPLGRSVRRRRGARRQRLSCLGRHLLPERQLACPRRREGSAGPASGRRRAHGVSRRGRRLAQRERDRRDPPTSRGPGSTSRRPRSSCATSHRNAATTTA